MPAEGASPSYSSQAASALSSRKAVPRVDQPVDPLARGELAAGPVALDRLLAAALRDLRRPLAQLRDELLHPLAPRTERVDRVRGR